MPLPMLDMAKVLCTFAAIKSLQTTPSGAPIHPPAAVSLDKGPNKVCSVIIMSTVAIKWHRESVETTSDCCFINKYKRNEPVIPQAPQFGKMHAFISPFYRCHLLDIATRGKNQAIQPGPECQGKNRTRNSFSHHLGMIMAVKSIVSTSDDGSMCHR